MSVILRPILTEKSTKIAEEGKFTFDVIRAANKNQIKKAVEDSFGVNVKEVWTTKLAAKTRRFGKFYKKLGERKKAIVKLVQGQTISLFETKQKGKKGGKK